MSLVVPSWFERYRVFSIDPGTHALGLSIWEIEYATASVLSIETTTIKPERFDFSEGLPEPESARMRRLEVMRRILADYIEQYRPIRVVYETPFFNRRTPGAYEPLLACTTMLQSLVMSYGDIQLVGIPPLLVKQAVQATSSKGKNPMFQAVCGHDYIRTRLVTPWEWLDEHGIDSLAVGLGDVLTYAR